MRKNRKSTTKLLLATIVLTATMGLTAYAAEWKQDTTGWWYEQDGGGYATGWNWIDGNGNGVAECYYFDGNGYMAKDTVIDNYTLNSDGQWIVDGVVQVQAVETKSALDSESVKFLGTWTYDYSTTGFGLPGDTEWNINDFDSAREMGAAHYHFAKYTFFEQNGAAYMYYNDNSADSKQLILMDNGMLRYDYSNEDFNYSQYFYIRNDGTLMIHSTEPDGYFIINQGDKSGTYFLHFYKTYKTE